MPDSKPLPKRRVERVVLGMTPEELKRFDEECGKAGVTRTAMLRRAIGNSLPDVLED